MIINSANPIVLIPSARSAARAAMAARDRDAFLSMTGYGPRLALNKGGFPETIPPLASADLNKRTPCQSPGRGRPH